MAALHVQRMVDNLRRFAAAQRLEQSVMAAGLRSQGVRRERPASSSEPERASEPERLERPLEPLTPPSLQPIHEVRVPPAVSPEPELPCAGAYRPPGLEPSTR
jgi:hypothetical protein